MEVGLQFQSVVRKRKKPARNWRIWLITILYPKSKRALFSTHNRRM